MPQLFDHLGFPLRRDDRAEREDGWQNSFTGIGTYADKTAHGRFFPTFRIMDRELVDIYNGSALGAKAVEKRPQEMFRRGYELAASKSGPKVSDKEVSAVREYGHEVLGLDSNVLEAMVFGRLFGGYLLVLGADDGGMPWEPLDETRIRSFRFLNGVDRRYAYVQSTYSRRGHPKYGKAQIYLLSNAIAHTGWDNEGESVRKRSPDELRGIGADIGLIHESRVIRFEGAPTDVVTRQQLAGWTYSVLQRVYQSMRAFNHAFDSAEYLISDASQGVLTMRGLFKKLGAPNGRAELQARMMALEMTRSVARVIAVDAGDGAEGKNAESFKRETTSFAGIPDMLDREMLRLCADMDIPANELFGQGGGGLNAAGEAESATRKWYDGIGTDQTTKLSPILQRIYRLIALAKRGPLKGRDVQWEITHHPLWAPTDKERATTQLTDAQRRSADIDSGIVTAEEAALSPEVIEVYPEIDLDSRREAMEATKSFDPYENDEPEEPPPVAVAPPAPGGEPDSPASPNTSIEAAPLGAPGEKPEGDDKAAAVKRGDADPDQARGSMARFSDLGSKGAHAASAKAQSSGAAADHHAAAKAHLAAASAHRNESSRRLGLAGKSPGGFVRNASAAKKHATRSGNHLQAADQHLRTVASGEHFSTTASRAPAGPIAQETALDAVAARADYDPDQPRAENGQFGEGGALSASQAAAAKSRLAKRSPSASAHLAAAEAHEAASDAHRAVAAHAADPITAAMHENQAAKHDKASEAHTQEVEATLKKGTAEAPKRVEATREQWAARPNRESLGKRLGKVAVQIRARDDHKCVYCGKGEVHIPPARPVDKHQLDHLVPRIQGGKDEASNLVTACKSCNSARHDMGVRGWAAYAKEKYGLSFRPSQIYKQAQKPLPEVPGGKKMSA